jgi:hypothetical protein
VRYNVQVPPWIVGEELIDRLAEQGSKVSNRPTPIVTERPDFKAEFVQPLNQGVIDAWVKPLSGEIEDSSRPSPRAIAPESEQTGTADGQRVVGNPNDSRSDNWQGSAEL